MIFYNFIFKIIHYLRLRLVFGKIENNIKTNLKLEKFVILWQQKVKPQNTIFFYYFTNKTDNTNFYISFSPFTCSLTC